MSDFSDNFKAENGDLLYGNNDARKKYLKHLSPEQQNLLGSFSGWDRTPDPNDPDAPPKMVGNKPGAWFIIDNYNNFFGVSGMLFELDEHSKEIVFDKGSMEDIGASYFVEQTASQTASDSNSQQAEQRRSYVEKINKSRFAPDQVPKASKQQLRGNLKEKEKNDEKWSRMANKAIRRACKFGIGMVATGLSSAFPLAKLHFILDGLELKGIAGKDLRVNGTGPERFEPITSSELRYAFRNWASLKNKMLFYVNLQIVPAPWESNWEKQGINNKPVKAWKDEWTNYQGRRESKKGYEEAIKSKSPI